jgi:YidC/Oxa1 family membrane protein insertase
LNAWDIVLLQPMINILIALSHYLFNNFGLTIVIFTLLIRFILLPLTLKQLRSSKNMMTLQPKLAELQKKYAKDKQKLAQEQMRLYKESGINPAGCAVPMLIQFPIWIALYQAIILTLAVNPEALLNLSRYFYSWAAPLAKLPLSNMFLGLNLAGTGNIIMALLVGVSMWVQQKMVTPTAQDPKQAQQAQLMLWMMPIMFTFLTLSFPTGLALYWVVSNIFSIVVQYYVTGWGGLTFKRTPSAGGSADRDIKLKQRLIKESSAPTEKPAIKSESSTEPKGSGDGKSRDIREDSRGSDQKGFNAIKRWFGRG